VDIATIGGQRPTADLGSLDPAVVRATRPPREGAGDEVADVARYRAVLGTIDALRRPLNVTELTRADLAGYAGVYVSGGHGAMGDFANDGSITTLMRWVLEADQPLAVVCHGLSALLGVRDQHGHWLLRDRRMTAFSHEEELCTGLAGRLPFVLQLELERLGARFELAPETWGSLVVQDGNLITGQNPYSSAALADAFVTRLAARPPVPASASAT